MLKSLLSKNIFLLYNFLLSLLSSCFPPPIVLDDPFFALIILLWLPTLFWFICAWGSHCYYTSIFFPLCVSLSYSSITQGSVTFVVLFVSFVCVSITPVFFVLLLTWNESLLVCILVPYFLFFVFVSPLLSFSFCQSPPPLPPTPPPTLVLVFALVLPLPQSVFPIPFPNPPVPLVFLLFFNWYFAIAN